MLLDNSDPNLKAKPGRPERPFFPSCLVTLGSWSHAKPEKMIADQLFCRATEGTESRPIVKWTELGCILPIVGEWFPGL